ncbi:MAG: hypothetical protein JRG91_09345 [Deltaproteobacteria bacterium]|nr:hypothetical protein [Deltaproteobacteria bacterium]
MTSINPAAAPAPCARAAAPSSGSRPAAADVMCAGSASPADVEAFLARYLEGIRSERRTARSVSSVMETLRAMESEKALKKGRRRARRLRASAVFQGVVSMAAAALSAVSAGMGAGAAQAASSATSRAFKAVGTATRLGSEVVGKVGPHLDPQKQRAESLALSRDAALARAKEQESFGRLANGHAEAVEAARRRVVEIMDRCNAARDAAGRAALSSRV